MIERGRARPLVARRDRDEDAGRGGRQQRELQRIVGVRLGGAAQGQVQHVDPVRDGGVDGVDDVGRGARAGAGRGVPQRLVDRDHGAGGHPGDRPEVLRADRGGHAVVAGRGGRDVGAVTVPVQRRGVVRRERAGRPVPREESGADELGRARRRGEALARLTRLAGAGEGPAVRLLHHDLVAGAIGQVRVRRIRCAAEVGSVEGRALGPDAAVDHPDHDALAGVGGAAEGAVPEAVGRGRVGVVRQPEEVDRVAVVVRVGRADGVLGDGHDVGPGLERLHLVRRQLGREPVQRNRIAVVHGGAHRGRDRRLLGLQHLGVLLRGSAVGVEGPPGTGLRRRDAGLPAVVGGDGRLRQRHDVPAGDRGPAVVGGRVAGRRRPGFDHCFDAVSTTVSTAGSPADSSGAAVAGCWPTTSSATMAAATRPPRRCVLERDRNADRPTDAPNDPFPDRLIRAAFPARRPARIDPPAKLTERAGTLALSNRRRHG